MSIIVAGKYRGKKIKSIDSLRPTMSKVRNAVFNILNSRINLSDGFVMVDFFCGTGIVAAEAISRGAEHVFMIDNNSHHLQIAWTNIDSINSIKKVTMINQDIVKEGIPSIDRKCHIVFIDPPYNQSVTSEFLIKLLNSNICDKDTFIVIEIFKNSNLEINNQYKIILERRYGSAKIIILQIL